MCLPGLRVESVERLADDSEVARRSGAEPETAASDLDRRSHDVGPRCTPVPGMGLLEGLERSWGRCGAGARVDRDAASVVEIDLAQATAEAGARQAAPGHLAVAVNDDRVAAVRPDVHERSTQRRDDSGFADVGDKHRRDGSVHGRAAEVDEIETGLRRQCIGCGHGAAAAPEELVLGHQNNRESASSIPRSAS